MKSMLLQYFEKRRLKILINHSLLKACLISLHVGIQKKPHRLLIALFALILKLSNIAFEIKKKNWKTKNNQMNV